jgi:hypothetical protein
MTSANVQGVGEPDPDKSFAADEARKSNLLLEAQLLRARQQTDEAAVKFALAAELEERLAEACLRRGLRTEAWAHRFSAAGCWAQAGNFHEAITVGDELLADPDVPPGLRERVQAYTTALRRREQCSAGLALATMGVE